MPTPTHYIILDLEATCWNEKGLKRKNEIIEIGALRFDAAGEPTGEFSRFVRPVLFPELSDFCRQLTSISQADVDQALPFPEVIRQFKDWAGVGTEPYLLCSWGFYDRNQLASDCALHHLDATWLEPHISLKHQHQTIRGLTKPMGMAGALWLEGLTLEGIHHRGIDDARNIAKIFRKYLNHWKI